MVEVANRRIRMVMAHSAMEWRCPGSGGVAGWVGLVLVIAMDQPERSIPAGLGEEVLGQIQEVAGEIVDGRTGQALGAGSVGPVDDERLANDVSTRDEAPIAAVERIVAVIAHGEEG